MEKITFRTRIAICHWIITRTVAAGTTTRNRDRRHGHSNPFTAADVQMRARARRHRVGRGTKANVLERIVERRRVGHDGRRASFRSSLIWLLLVYPLRDRSNRCLRLVKKKKKTVLRRESQMIFLFGRPEIICAHPDSDSRIRFGRRLCRWEVLQVRRL